MKQNLTKFISVVIVLGISLLLQGCLFEYIKQPKSAQPGEVIEIELSVNDAEESNSHKGVLGIIVPSDWSFVSADYTSPIGNGMLTESPEWKDSVEQSFPSSNYGSNVKWIVLLSDKGYSYSNSTSFITKVKLKVGQEQGCYNLGYLTTKATSGMLSSGNPTWAPLSFPHPIGVPDSNLCSNPFKTRTAPDWTNLLDRQSGWTGSDGIYSIPLDENERPSGSETAKHLVLFSDTFIGGVNQQNQRVNSRIVNNTLAFINGTEPLQENIEFFWREDTNNVPYAMFVPETPNANEGDWYWLMDGISLDDTIYVFALRLNSTGGGGGFGFEVNGVALLKFNLDENNQVENVNQFDTPLYHKSDTTGEIVFGQAVMCMTSSSNNPSPDGYIYVYGPRSTNSNKELLAARVLPENIEDFDQWEYWNGTEWDNNIENCASITAGISQEFSVTPLGKSKYLLVVQAGNTVSVKVGESPVGPFGIFHTIYECPEVLEDPDIFVYNAKAHPSLSTKDEILISYNVNSFSFTDLYNNADIYRPRFIYLEITDTALTNVKEIDGRIKGYMLEQNYPNPFNPETNFKYRISENGYVTLKVFDVLGNEVSTLVNEEKTPGEYKIVFSGSNLASGVYYYQLRLNNSIETKKMMLLK